MSRTLSPVAILAGGLGTRLQPLNEQLPKALVDVNGEPFLAHQLRRLRDHGVERVVICAGHLGGMIQHWLGDGERFGLRVAFSFDGPRLLGTGGAIRKAVPLLGDEFFVLYGDSYLRCDYRAVQTAFEASGKLALMTVFRNENRWDASNVELVAGRIVAYEKRQPTPRMQHVDYGLGIFSAAAFATVAVDQPCDLATVYQDLLARDRLAAYEVSERFYEIGSPAGLAETRRHLRGEAERVAGRQR
jgi:N-acetyl-alpha-D-muramate 1-phosphate uridylyltransferase